MRIAETIEELRQYFLDTETKNLLNRQGSILVLSCLSKCYLMLGINCLIPYNSCL